MSAVAVPYRAGKRGWSFRMTPVRIALLTIAGLATGLTGYRLLYGLGVVTNLTDSWPWALWTWWKLTGVALAGAGYSTALVVHFVGRERWKQIERGAFLTSLLGYLMVATALILDLGQWYNAWHPVFFWGYHSVMFELFWCIGGYTVVQLVEFVYIFEERVPLPRLRPLLKRIYAPLLILGGLLPVFHQSALGSLYVIAKGRMDPLWWSMLIPIFFVLSSFFVGPAVVVIEEYLSTRTYPRRPPLPILAEMARVASVGMFLYLALKIADYAWRGVLPELFGGSGVGNLGLAELVLGVLLPAVMFLLPAVRRSTGLLLAASCIAVAGVVVNRFDFVIVAMWKSIGVSYAPYWMEVVFVLGLAAAVALGYLFVAENFPILEEPVPRARVAPERRVLVASAHRRATRRPTVIGVGNLLMGDEGLGVHAARMVRERAAPGVRVVEAGGVGLHLLAEVEGASRLLVLDCIDAGREPGEVLRMSGEDLAAPASPRESPHEFGLADLLAAVALHGKLPREVVVMGVQPARIEPTTELSPEVGAALPRLVDEVLALLARREEGLSA